MSSGCALSHPILLFTPHFPPHLPAHVDMSAAVQDLPHLLLVLFEEVLDVHLVLAVTGERRVDLAEHSLLQVLIELVLVDEILRTVTTAKVQDVLSKGLT